MSKNIEITIKKTGERPINEVGINVFSTKFKKKSYFSLNSGNFYVTLQLELCPFGSWFYRDNNLTEDKTLLYILRYTN